MDHMTPVSLFLTHTAHRVASSGNRCFMDMHHVYCTLQNVYESYTMLQVFFFQYFRIIFAILSYVNVKVVNSLLDYTVEWATFGQNFFLIFWSIISNLYIEICSKMVILVDKFLKHIIFLPEKWIILAKKNNIPDGLVLGLVPSQ